MMALSGRGPLCSTTVEPEVDCAIAPDGRTAFEASQQAITSISAPANGGMACHGDDGGPRR
jgi:hypothetical protein